MTRRVAAALLAATLALLVAAVVPLALGAIAEPVSKLRRLGGPSLPLRRGATVAQQRDPPVHQPLPAGLDQRFGPPQPLSLPRRQQHPGHSLTQRPPPLLTCLRAVGSGAVSRGCGRRSR